MSVARCGLALAALLIATAPALALDAVVEKKTFTLPSYTTTTSGKTLKDVKVGWEAYGTLNADKSNAILITHFFSANSHAAGNTRLMTRRRATGTPSSAPASRSTPTSITSSPSTRW